MSKKIAFLVVIWGLFLTWTGWGWLAIHRIQKPVYAVAQNRKGYEVREYQPYVLAQIESTQPWGLAQQEGFKILDSYLNGSNSVGAVAGQSQKIADAAPLLQQATDAGWLVSLILPAAARLNDIPRPNDPRVRLVQASEQTVAVLAFSGRVDQKKSQFEQQHLLDLLRADKQTIISEPWLVQYNLPWTPPFLRRNEIHVRILPRP